MSNPTTLHELADSLAVQAQAAFERAHQGLNTQYHAGYSDALLDTRATVLAMIHEAEERELLARRNFHKAAPILPSSVTTTVGDYPCCVTCGLVIKHLPAGQGWVHEATGMVVGDGR